jgi:kynureninase
LSASAGADPLLAYRERFPILARTLHFASHTLGAMPEAVESSLAEYARTWNTRGIRAWEEQWMGVPRQVAGSLETLLHAEAGSVSLHPNVTIAQAVAFSGIEFTPARPRLVCTEEDFPSVLYLYEGLARRGAEIVRVPAHDGRRVAVEDVVAAIDERTAVVAISQVLFRTAQVVDVAPIARRARAVGALSMIDAYQGVGTLDVDVREPRIDVMTGGSIKWLCGGPGTGWLYVRPDLALQMRPAITGWFGHEHPFAFDSGPQRYDAGERRFMNGTPSIPSYLASGPGIAIAAEIGGAAIRAKSLRQTTRMVALADEYGLPVGSPRVNEQRGGTVCLDVPGAEAACQALLARDVLLDYRPGVGLRLAPHYYTRDDELDEVMRLVRDSVRAASHA